MGKEIPLGRIAGVNVAMRVSVLAVGALYTVVLAQRLFPVQSPGLSSAAYWSAGAGAAFLLFFSLLVHEIGHALVARDEGIGVRGMALTLLGGETRMESSPATAGAELRVGIIGPLASAACGVAFLSGSYALPEAGTVGLFGHLLAWLGFVNVFLASFNLLPASPLDGGRVLSSLVWMRTGDRVTAMRVAAGVGVAAGLGLAGLAVWGIDGGQGAEWAFGLLLVGGFVTYNAGREIQAAPVQGRLASLQTSDAMAIDPPTARSSSTITDFLRGAPDRIHHGFPVVGDAGTVTGLLTAAAIRSVPPERWSTVLVEDLAAPLDQVTRLRPTDDLLTAAQRVDGSDVRVGIVVADDATVVGTLDHTAVMRALALGRPPA